MCLSCVYHTGFALEELEDLQGKNGHFCDFARFRLHCIQKISCLLPDKKRKTFPFYNKNVLAKTVFFCYTLANEYSCNREDVMEKNVLNTDLTGKVAVVTGASGTLCSIFAKALARAGAKVALLGRNMDKLKELADEIEAEGGTAKGYTCNVMNKANCLQVAEDVLADFGPCDILVNGAGGNNARANTDKEYFEMADLESDTVTFFDLDESGVEMVFNLNFIGTLLPTQAFARQMVGREGCNILNISSMNAYLPLTKIPAYSGSKAAVTNFTQWLAVHFSKVGIRVNAIAPGFFASEQNAKLLFNEDGTPTERTKKILAATPMGHFGDSEKDLVGALLFLLNNEAAGFITGICLPVDGGFSAYSGV